MVATPKPDYLSRDYAGLRDSLLTFASASFPDWQPASEGDFGLAMVELFSYMGDILSYYTDRAQMENYLATATQRASVLALAYQLGYTPTAGAPATGSLTFITDTTAPAVLVPAGTQITTGRIEALDGPVVFETDADVTVPAAGGTVVATVTEGETVAYLKIGESTGFPGQAFVLPDTGVYPDTIKIYVESPGGSTSFTYAGTTVNALEWTREAHLLDAEGSDQSFESFLSSVDSTTINFGDDINGAIPATGLRIFTSYRHGNGSNGNVDLGAVYLINSRDLHGVHVSKDTNDVYISGPMIGGADPESNDSIRYNAPRAYRTQNRTVSAKDFRDLALSVEGVAKANVVVGTFTSVTVYITGPDAGAPTQTLKDLVASKFTDKTLAGVTVTVASPTFIPVNFGSSGTPVTVELYDQYSQKAVKAQVRTAIKSFFNDLLYGNRLTVGEVYNVIKAVNGVRYIDIPIMARNDSAQSGTVTITPRPWEILTVGTINLSATGGVA
jgi:hypothetical protein